MADELASLQIRVQSLEAELADRRLRGLTGSGRKAEMATAGLTRAFLRFAGPAAIVAGTMASLNKTVQSTRTFEVLNAQLITATGSAEGAAVAFEAIQDFASNTPYDLAQVTEAFTKMVNLGLNPSEEALTSYGDTASAMGKDLNQMIEAVADAATGEFERLKEFGIRASKQGDQVSFTFRGMTDTVRFNAEEIEKYLINLGQNNFAGAMAERMDTLDGALSNLGDEWEKLWMNIGQAGVGDLIEGQVRGAIDALTEMNSIVASGQLAGYIDAYGKRFLRIADDIIQMVTISDTAVSDWLEKWVTDGDEAMDILGSAFMEFPENVKAAIEIAWIEIQSFDKRVEAVADMIRGHLDFTTLWKDPLRIGPGARYQESLDAIESGRQEAIASVLEEREQSVQAFQADVDAADNARKAYDKALESRQNLTGDRLAPFQFDSGGGDDSGDDDESGTKIAKKIKGLQDQADMAWATGRQLELLKLKSEGASEAQLMMAQEAYKTIEAMDQLNDELKEQQAINEQADSIVNSLKTQEQQVRDSYQRRREIIMESTRLTADERNNAMIELERQYQEDLLAANDSFWARWLNGARQSMMDFQDLSNNVISNFSTGFGNAFESIILDSKDTDEALKDMLRGLIRGTVNALGQMAAQWLAYQAVELMVGRTTQASAASTQIANANAMVAMSALNAFASTAAIPVVGPVAAPGAAAAATAATAPMAASVAAFSLAGIAHEGIDQIPREGTWLLDKGERVTGASLNKDLTEFLKRENERERRRGPAPGTNRASEDRSEGRTGGDMNPTVVMQLTAGVPEAVQVEINRLMPQIVAATIGGMKQAIGEGGEMARAVGRK